MIDTVNKFSRIAYILAFVMALSRPVFAQQSKSIGSEAGIKTALVYKFMDNVMWKEEDLMTEFVICVLDHPEKAKDLRTLAKIRKFRNRLPIRIVEAKSAADIPECNLLVINGKSELDLWAVYSKIRGKRVLMLADELRDYKKCMISFYVKDGKVNYITNKTKLDESKLTIKPALYKSAIQKEGEWTSLFDKLEAIANSKDKSITADASEIKQMLQLYRNMQEAKEYNEARLTKVSDSLNLISATLDVKLREAAEITSRIDQQKKNIEKLDKDIVIKQKEIELKEKTIGQKDTVIYIIAGLSLLGIILLLFTIRSNNQRRRANLLLVEQNAEIERQKHLVDEKQKEILDSINYAKRIQTALMANAKMMNENLPEHFIFFKPKDIVAGDFYWATPVSDGFVYITADSTGHGVPGAFMSLLNISKLNDAINKNKTRPDLVLNEVKDGIIKALNPEGSSEESKDGMDAILCKLDHKNMKLQYAAANNSFCIVRDKQVITCKADKMPVGKSHDDNGTFTFNEMFLEKGDMIYTFTDGYGDQFGGPEGKKFKHKNLREVFVQISDLPIYKQNEVLSNKFDEWKGELEQVDDVLIIGVRV